MRSFLPLEFSVGSAVHVTRGSSSLELTRWTSQVRVSFRIFYFFHLLFRFCLDVFDSDSRFHNDVPTTHGLKH